MMDDTGHPILNGNAFSPFNDQGKHGPSLYDELSHHPQTPGPPLALASHLLTAQSPLFICLLGGFRVLVGGEPVPLHSTKAESLLRLLGAQHDRQLPRDVVLEALWPGHALLLASQSLYSLIHSLRKSPLGQTLHGHAPVVCQDGYCYLNTEAGVGVDVASFKALIHAGNQLVFANDLFVATSFYVRAVELYRGDMVVQGEIESIMERERLRAFFLTALARLADFYFSVGNYTTCREYATRLLDYDPCREDAHRLVMRCYVRLGERAQALRQYRLCQHILQVEFDAMPELQTTRLYEQVRLDPESV